MNIADRTINALQSRSVDYQQPEGSTLPYTFNYASVLNGDTILTSTWEAKGSATVATPTNTTTTASIKLSGPAGLSTIINTITTAAGITDQRIINLRITDNDDYVAGDY